MLARFTPLNWLLVALATWALGFALVTLAGFGGRYTLEGDNPGLAPALPSARVSASKPALQPLQAYAEAANRPLFYPDRRPTTARAVDTPADQPLDVVLTSVIITPQLRMAIVHDNASNKSLGVREGQPIIGGPQGWKLVEVTPRQAIFEGAGGRSSLDLRVFNGQGGEPPTANGLNPQVVSASNANPPPPPPMPQPPATPVLDPNAVPPMMRADAANAQAAAQAATEAADAASNAEAASAAEAIRQRIEARRKQAQVNADGASPTTDKVQ